MSDFDGKLRTVIEMSLSARPTELGCDECFELLASYAERLLAGEPVDDSLKLVQEHLERCDCCKEEFELLLAVLRSREQEK
jgi:hypothetical protein